MLCSARELGLSEDHGGLLALPTRAAAGRRDAARVVLDLDDRSLLKLTPNRADCLSVLGVAREVSALTGAPLALPPMRAGRADDRRAPAGRIEAPELCGASAAA
jgi:phenylalanyl-tRNA synthetase beta chain